MSEDQQSNKLVNDFLMLHMAKICPEPFLSLYISQNKMIPFTHLQITVPKVAPATNQFKKIVTIFFHNKEFAKAEFYTEYIHEANGRITAKHTMKEMPLSTTSSPSP